MQNKQPVKVALLQAMKERGVKTPALSAALGIPKDRIYKWFQEGTKPKEEDAVKIWDWINGENVPRDTLTAAEPSPDSYLKKRQIIKNGEKKNQVPFYDAEAAAGLTETDMTPIHAPAGTIDVGDLLHDSKAAISIYGNSMLPSYPPGGE